ncbi:MAG: DUF3788 domain-containing protein [Planctomycetes bacterium]|nr:DUF3788 domain-containing protein [Planctomycetota bacterium]
MPSAFLVKAEPPSDAALEAALGPAAGRWKRLRADLEEERGALAAEWSYGGKAYGWSLRLRAGKRTLLYLIPGPRRFTAALALGEEACRAAREAGLPGKVLALVAAAASHPEGRAVRMEVRTAADAAAVRRLAALKAAR